MIISCVIIIKILTIMITLMTVGTTLPRKILNNGKVPCEPLMTSSYAHHS